MAVGHMGKRRALGAPSQEQGSAVGHVPLQRDHQPQSAGGCQALGRAQRWVLRTEEPWQDAPGGGGMRTVKASAPRGAPLPLEGSPPGPSAALAAGPGARPGGSRWGTSSPVLP